MWLRIKCDACPRNLDPSNFLRSLNTQGLQSLKWCNQLHVNHFLFLILKHCQIDDGDITFDNTQPLNDNDHGNDSSHVPQEPIPKFCDQGTQICEEEWNEKIAEAIINMLHLKQQQVDSIKSFEEWPKWAKDFVITDQRMKDKWPTSLSETERIFIKVGYESSEQYYLCMNDHFPREWAIMESCRDKCRHCGEPGTIDYYNINLYRYSTRTYRLRPINVAKFTAITYYKVQRKNAAHCTTLHKLHNSFD